MDRLNEKLQKQFAGELLLMAVILARSISFVITKIGLQGMDAFTLLALRFLTAFIFLLPFSWTRLWELNIKSLFRGALLGASFFLVMAAEVTALKTTSASSTAFLENTAIIFVPIFEAFLLRRLPKPLVIISSIITLIGVALLTLTGEQLSLSLGEILCLIAAITYAASIILTDRFSKKEDPLLLGVLQVGFMGVFSLVTAFVTETPRLPNSMNELGIIIALAIVCTGFGFTLQPLAQSKTSSEKAGLFCAISPLSTAVIAYIFLGELLGLSGVIGISLILLGLLLINATNSVIKEGNLHDQPSFRTIIKTKRL